MLLDDILTVDSPEDLMLDKEADELEDAEDDVISNDGSDIDMIADITDDDIIAAEVDALDRGESDEDEDEDNEYDDDEEYEEEHYYRESKDEDDDDEYEDYDVDEDDDDEEKENHHHWGDKHNCHKHWGDRHHEEEDD